MSDGFEGVAQVLDVDSPSKRNLLTRPGHAHVVQFYDAPEPLYDAVSQFLACGFADSEPAVVIATDEHRAAFAARLAENRIQLAPWMADDGIWMLDAATTLASFMVDGVPDPALFEASIGGVMARINARHPGRPIRAYGEMVDLLWRDGNGRAALRLEELWNDLAKRYVFSLFCSYTLGDFYSASGGDDMHAVCAAHSHVIPSSGEHAMDVVLLQQRARALEHEVERRKQLEGALRSALEDKTVAQSHLEALYRRTAMLQAITAELSHTLSAEEVVAIVIRETRAVIEAEAGGVLLLDNTGTAIERFLIDGEVRTDNVVEARRFDLAADTPICEAARTGQLVWIVGHDAINSRYPHLAGLRVSTGAQTWGALPIVFQGRTLGSIGFRCTVERPLSQEERDFLFAVGRQCGQAIERARLVEATQAARSEAERASLVKDDFLAMLGHELRNPLSPILSAVQLMKLRGEATSAREQDIIERQVNHLMHLVDDLLDVSRITQGKIELHMTDVSLATLIASAIEIAGPHLGERRHHVTVSVPDDDIWVHADEARLCQVFTNLLTNAAKYTEPGGTVDVRVERGDGDVTIRIRDNGIGIPAELLPHVFELFVQGLRGSDRGQGGLGIGLALVRSLVTMHGGQVSVASEGSQRGTEIAVWLPTIDAQRATAPEVTSSLRAPVTPRRVLVVDDNHDAAALLGELLESLGHEVVVANSGLHALAAIAQCEPEVAILDIGLPEMDGYELAVALHDRIGPQVRLIAVTGYGQEQDRERAARAGFAAHFAKPVRLATLVAAIDGTDTPPDNAPSDRSRI